MDTMSFSDNTGLYNFFVQPFPIHFDSNDLHVIVFFDGHSEYESIEAMIQVSESKAPYIRAIITRLDKTQIDHINDKNVVEWLKSRKRKREVHYIPISCIISGRDGRKKISMSFTSFKGESIVLETSPASRATAKYGGLINPKGHSRHMSLPVMYAEKSTLISPKSRICIDGTDYKIPVKVRVPLFFKGMEGYYSEFFNIGVIRAGMERNLVLDRPEKLQMGKQWVYKSGNDIRIYKITKADNNQITVKGRNEEIQLELTDEGVVLAQVKVYSSCNLHDAVFSMYFNPGIVLWAKSDKPEINRSGVFSISVNKYTSLITGTVNFMYKGGSTDMLLKPRQPEWAIERSVSLSIKNSNNEFSISTEII